MRSIKLKLIVSTSAMLLASLLVVSFIVLSRQIKAQRTDLEEVADYIISIVDSQVESFF